MRDKLIKCLVYEKRVSVICCDTTDLVEKARKLHDLSPTATAALGRLLTITTMMAVGMKGLNNKLTIQLKGNGPIGTMVTVANHFPHVKGYVANPLVDLPLREDGKLDVGAAVGHEGYVNVIKDIGLKEPYIGMTPIVSGEIAEDFANYFLTSEQKETAVGLGVLVDKEGVKRSGGYIISPMPDATPEDIAKIEKAVVQAGAISKLLNQDLGLLEIVQKITGDEHVALLEDEIVPNYECDCSKEGMKRALISIGKEELEDMIKKEGKAELVCHFCNQAYSFTQKELEELIQEIG